MEVGGDRERIECVVMEENDIGVPICLWGLTVWSPIAVIGKYLACHESYI